MIRGYGFRLLLACSFFTASEGIFRTALHAETRTAAALTPEAVWEAINAAKDGDTVQLPEGTAVWSKGWNSGHGAKMKAIIIRGVGIDKTVICDRRTRGYFVPFQLLGVEGKPFRVTGITFGRRQSNRYLLGKAVLMPPRPDEPVLVRGDPGSLLLASVEPETEPRILRGEFSCSCKRFVSVPEPPPRDSRLVRPTRYPEQPESVLTPSTQ